jgi:hypothetical protein
VETLTHAALTSFNATYFLLGLVVAGLLLCAVRASSNRRRADRARVQFS